MTDTQKNAVLFVPFWRQGSHVGNHRMDRFARWLADDDYNVIMVCAGASYGERQQAWGLEITVQDPLNSFRNTSPWVTDYAPPRKPNKLRAAVVEWVFNPDHTILWARKAAKHPSVVQATRDAAFILSSSPFESAHVGAWFLSRRTGIPHIVDMRDGWLDEPLHPLLRTSALRRWREGRLEARILRDAKAIQVTSEVWKTLLCDRYPAYASKVHVLTNGYPQSPPALQPKAPRGPRDEIVLIHAGCFTNSHQQRTPDLLLEPLLRNLSGAASCGVVQLIGPLSNDDHAIIEALKSRFAAIGWRIECPGSLPRSEVLALLPKADGLLLLSASRAALPSKLFEYIPTGRPMFVSTYKDSATWSVCASLPQVTLVDPSKPDLDHQKTFYAKPEFRIPPEFSERSLAQTFKNTIDL